MSGPFIFVSGWKVKEGQSANYEEWTKGLIAFAESKEPRMIAFHLFANEDGSEVTSIQVHPDAASMQAHMGEMREYIQQAYGDFLEAPTVLVACGEGEDTREMMQKLVPPGFSLTPMSRHVAGFTRSSAEA